VHVTQRTLDHLRGEYQVEPGQGHTRNQYLRENNITTFLIVPPENRRKPFLFNNLNVFNTAGGKRKPSFKVVSSLVVQLLHSIKFSMEVPFSNITQQPVEMQKTITTKKMKFADRFKIRRKRHGTSLPHQPSNRVNRFLSHAIEARSVDQEKANHVNAVTLSFRDSDKERQYQEDQDIGFPASLSCSLLLTLLMAGIQALVLPRTTILLLLFLTAFIWIAVILMLLLAVRLRCILWDLSRSFLLRLAITIFSIILIYTMAQVNVFTCQREAVSSCSMTSKVVDQPASHRLCLLPHYILISCMLSYLAVSIFLRLPIAIKSLLLGAMGVVYILLIELSHAPVFACWDQRSNALMPLHITAVIVAVVFVLAVAIHGRQVEWMARLDFLWQVQAREEKLDMEALQGSNRRILFNLLPAHVATHFLDNQFRSNMELYSQSYSRVGVVFASITNFHEFYTELDVNYQGVECIRLLNEIIADFDDLLGEERFRAIDKIKTIGSTYMAAVGLVPELRIAEDTEDGGVSANAALTQLAEFVFALREKLANLNEHSYNNFMLRVGMNVGPVVAGVIGARKPQYDIWGNTVNVASRMDSTGLPNHTQVTEEIFDILKHLPYEFQLRGDVKVKGKGNMTTYFLTGRRAASTMRMDDLVSQASLYSNQQPTSPLSKRLMLPRLDSQSPSGSSRMMPRLPALEEEQPLLPPRTSSRIMPAQTRPPVLPPRQEVRNIFYQDRSIPPRSSRSAPPTGPAPPPPVQILPLHPPLPAHVTQRRVVEAVVRTNQKLRTSHNNMPRHHSEESLQARAFYASKIHSSADEISSMNRSEDSSSDESFSRTDFSRTDAESPSPPSRPKNKAPWLYPSDIQIDPSSLESSPKLSQCPPFPNNIVNHLRLPTVGQSPSPAHHDEFRSEIESELDFDINEEAGAAGAGEKLCSRLELPPGVVGVESCRSAMSSAMESYIGDSCGSFEFVPKESHRRLAKKSTESPPRDIKREIEARAGELETSKLLTEPSVSDSGLELHHKKSEETVRVQSDTVDSARSGESRRSSGSDRRSSGGRSSGSEKRRHRKISTNSDKKIDGVLPGLPETNCDKDDQPRAVESEVLRNMARSIKPPPVDPLRGDLRSPKARPRVGRSKDSQGFGPTPSFEKEIQRIIAEQEVCKQSTSLDRSSEPVRGQESRPTPHESTSPPAPDKDSSPSTQDQESQESSPSKMKELQEKLAKLNSRYVVGSGCSGEKSEVGKVGLAALQDIAARQEATLEDKTPTNDQSLLRYDPISNKMSLGSLPSSPARSAQSRSLATGGKGRESDYEGKGKESEYENLGSETGDSDLEQKVGELNPAQARVGGAISRDSEQREIDEFEEEERRLLNEEEEKHFSTEECSPGLLFALPGRWTGGKREEDEMRRLVSAQRDLHTGGETSQSDWSEEEEEEVGGALDQLSMAANGGLTDAEGALSDVNSIYGCGDNIGDPEMDDTSLSSRASSRLMDSDQIYSADSLHGGMYDSEYDNYRGCMTSDCESEMFGDEGDGAEAEEAQDPFNLQKIRQLSQNITNKFGNRSDVENSEA